MKQYLLGIDIGTSACKVALFCRDGSVAALDGEGYEVYYPHPGWAEQNPEEWWEAVCTALRRMLKKSGVNPEEIAGIGVDGQSWSAIAIDKAGNVLANTPIWMDTRADRICTELNERLGEERIFAVAGNPMQPSYTTGKILWYQREMPQMYEKIDTILQSNSFIVYRLTGMLSQDKSQGYGLHCFNMREGVWDEALCKELGIPFDFLPDIYECDAIVGTVTKEAAARCGLAEGTPVVAGGLDAACGTLGAGVIHSGQTQEQGGQAGGMSICMDTYKADRRLILSCHVVPGHWLLQGGTTGGGGVMRWIERELAGTERAIAEESGRSTLEVLNDTAGAVPAGSDGVVFLPYMSGERSPIWDPNAKGVFYGLDFGKTRGHLVRAAMEGVAYSLRHNLETAKEAGVDVQVLRAMGGSANSWLWTQIKADITGKRIEAMASDTATTLGAAILAGVGTGVYRDYDEAVSCIRVRRVHEPNPENREVYDKNYKNYIGLYENLKDMMKN
ncbi:MAG: xylulokinase [Lachnospiraceae bacterium]|nr:xylulokinase [Lachnospiraceae bacterium]